MSMLVFSTSKRHFTVSLKSCGYCCWSMVLMATWYWFSNHCIPADKFVPVLAVLNHNFSPCILDFGKPVTGGHVSRKTGTTLLIVYMNWIDSHSQVEKDVTVGHSRINRLISTDNLELLASSVHDIQHTFGQISAVCSQAEMKISSLERLR